MEYPFNRKTKRSIEAQRRRGVGEGEKTPSQQALRLVAIAKDANRGWPELTRTNPKLATEFKKETKAIADAKRRAQTDRTLLEMRLD